ncbi:protein LDOC1-like [Pleurodeles waltl]|uniref:protein LDOC1-like n=1 Tax=Pleurodeles waltl TaxID=8319 RepID=UPI0037099C9D
MEEPLENVLKTAQFMLHTVQQQAQELQQLNAENTALRQAMVSQSLNRPTVSTSTPRYAGDPNKLKEFLYSVTVYFAFGFTQFTQEKTKVGYLISALSGPALAWVTPLVAAEDSLLSNYAAFFKAFKQMFERPGLDATAEEALWDIQQGNQDFLNYLTHFKQLAQKLFG